MREKHPTEADIAGMFRSGKNCAQVVATEWAEELGYAEHECMQMTAAFGGGCYCGDLCGAAAGAMLVIGLYFGMQDCAENTAAERVREIALRFREAFEKRFGSMICRELLGFDFSKEGQYALAVEAGAQYSKCPLYVHVALEILDALLL